VHLTARALNRVTSPHYLIHPSSPMGSRYDTELHKHWWARTVSNRRPLVCKTRALPLSYAPYAPEAGYTPAGRALKTSGP
jgi:hypothetical protein